MKFAYSSFHSKKKLEPIRRAGVINLIGVGRSGFAKLAMVTTDIAKGLTGLEVIVVTALHQKDYFARGEKPWIRLVSPT